MGNIKIEVGNLVVSPVDGNEVTKDKEYQIIGLVSDSVFKIKNNKNKTLFCKTSKCGHINDNDWIIK